MAMGFELLHETESIVVVVLRKKCNFLPICDPWCYTHIVLVALLLENKVLTTGYICVLLLLLVLVKIIIYNTFFLCYFVDLYMYVFYAAGSSVFIFICFVMLMFLLLGHCCLPSNTNTVTVNTTNTSNSLSSFWKYQQKYCHPSVQVASIQVS